MTRVPSSRIATTRCATARSQTQVRKCFTCTVSRELKIRQHRQPFGMGFDESERKGLGEPGRLDGLAGGYFGERALLELSVNCCRVREGRAAVLPAEDRRGA